MVFSQPSTATWSVFKHMSSYSPQQSAPIYTHWIKMNSHQCKRKLSINTNSMKRMTEFVLKCLSLQGSPANTAVYISFYLRRLYVHNKICSHVSDRGIAHAISELPTKILPTCHAVILLNRPDFMALRNELIRCREDMKQLLNRLSIRWSEVFRIADPTKSTIIDANLSMAVFGIFVIHSRLEMNLYLIDNTHSLDLLWVVCALHLQWYRIRLALIDFRIYFRASEVHKLYEIFADMLRMHDKFKIRLDDKRYINAIHAKCLNNQLIYLYWFQNDRD